MAGVARATRRRRWRWSCRGELLYPWKHVHARGQCPPADACAARQVKNITQVISPEEYDEAVRADPMSSTLSATGDHRPGRQLLADAVTDRLQTVASLAGSPRGRAELDAMAAAAEALVLDAGQRPGE